MTDAFDWFKNRDVEPDQLFALPDAAVYNEPRDLRQNIFSDTWLETYDTVLDYGPYNEGLNFFDAYTKVFSPPTHRENDLDLNPWVIFSCKK